MNNIALLYFHMASWFAENEPGTPTPDWCFLAWPMDEETCSELVDKYEKDTGKKITDMS